MPIHRTVRRLNPIRVFFSPLTRRFYATRHWKVLKLPGGKEIVECTGEKFDVTQDIAHIIVQEKLEFEPEASLPADAVEKTRPAG